MPDNKKKNEVESIVLARTKGEYEIDRQNHIDDNNGFEIYMNLYNLIGDEPDEDWQSNIRLPEFLSGMLTQSSIEAFQEFRRRDFVEIYHESKEKEHMAAGEAKKELINRTLNQPHVHYFQKRMRASGLKNITGKVYFACWWERKTIKVTETQPEIRGTGEDVNGLLMGLEDNQIEANEVFEEEVENEQVIYDRWNIDVLDPRNVFTSPEYTYSMQDKKRVWVRTVTDFATMEEQQERMGYINLKEVEDTIEGKGGGTTQSKIDTKEDGKENQEYKFTAMPEFDVNKCWCKEYVVIDKKDIEQIKPGVDEQGIRVKGAVLMEIVKAFADIKGQQILVMYQRNKNRDPYGNAYRPIIRGKCYIHPTDDMGFGDGLAARQLQTGMDDNFNLANDRVRIATEPTIKASTASATDFRNTWNYGPRAVFEAYDANDIQEMIISDDITGSLNVIQMLRGMQQQASATFETTQGGRGAPSETATAVAEGATRTDARSHYKALTYEHTAINEIFQMICWQTWQFALPETAEKMMGKKVFDFNPFLDHTFKPVSEAIETEYSKNTKLNIYNNQFAQVASIPNPNTLKVLNKILLKTGRLLGDEHEEVIEALFDEESEFTGTQGGIGTPANAGGSPVNQTGLPSPRGAQR